MSDKKEIEKSCAPLMDHLTELRVRLIRAILAFLFFFLVCFFFSKQIFNVLLLPYEWAVLWSGLSKEPIRLIYIAPQEFFLVQVKVAFFGGAFLAFPLICMEIYKFIAPALYKRERTALFPFLIASPLFFLLGACLVYFIFTPAMLWFFLAMQQNGENGQAEISFLPRVSEYLSLVMTLIFSFGLVFQIPIVTTLIAYAGLVSYESLKNKRKWAIVLSFVLAAILTPPDPLSQIGLALPLILLYELSLYAVRFFEKKRTETENKNNF